MKNTIVDDACYLLRCLELAASAGEKGNSSVGAVIVRQNEIIAEAEEANKTKNDVTCHAEIEALRMAVHQLQVIDLSDCILYTTHEPCVMCSYAIRFYKVGKVVYIHAADYLGGVTSSIPLLTSHEVPPNWGNPPEIVCKKIPL